MQGVFRFVDPDDTSVVRLDMNALGNTSGQGSGFGLLGDLNMGQSNPDDTNDYIEMSFRLWAKVDPATENYDDLITYIDALRRELDRDVNLIEWRPEGSSVTKLIEIEKSPLPSIFYGQNKGINRVVGLLLENEGIPVTARRKKYTRSASTITTEFTGLNAPRNGVGTKHVLVENPGTAPALAKLTITPQQSGAKVVQVKVGRRSKGNLTSFENMYSFDIDDATAGADSSSGGDAESAGGTALFTSFDAIPWMRRRWRKVIEAPDEGTVRGRYRAFVSLRGTQQEGLFELQLRWASGDRDPAEVSNRRIEYDGRDLEDFEFAEIDLGFINVVDSKFTLEGWARRLKGEGGIHWDTITLIPADEYFGVFTVPGLRGAGASRTTWRGVELYTANGVPVDDASSVLVVNNDDVRLNSEGDKVENPGNLELLDAGRHTVRAVATVRNMNETDAKIGRLSVINGSGGEVKGIPLRGHDKRIKVRRKKSLTFEASGSTEYRFRVELTNKPNDSNARITVHTLQHHFQRYMNPGASMIIDATKKIAYLEDANDQISRVGAQGGFVELAPGSNLLIFSFGDIPMPGYDDVIENQVLTRYDQGRACNVTIEVTPQYVE